MVPEQNVQMNYFPILLQKCKKFNYRNVIESHARYRHMFLIFSVSLYQVAALWHILNLLSGDDAGPPGCDVTSDLSDLFHLQ